MLWSTDTETLCQMINYILNAVDCNCEIIPMRIFKIVISVPQPLLLVSHVHPNAIQSIILTVLAFTYILMGYLLTTLDNCCSIRK